MAYVLLGAAIVMELIATTLLKYTEGFTKLYPTFGCIALYIVCFFCLSRALLKLNLGIAYATWCGIGIVAATLIALLALSLDGEAEWAVHRAVRARVRVALGGVGLTLNIELRRQDGGLVVAIRRAGGGREHVRALGGGGGAPEQLKPALRTGARRVQR